MSWHGFKYLGFLVKVAVLVSGGVDSSLVLQLLYNKGHDLTAFYLKIWLEEDLSYLGSCPWEQDLYYVKKLCNRLNVPLRIISLQDEYWKRVINYTLDAVKNGRTPNPDILCNSRVKFGAFYDRINNKFEKVATGHYAVVEKYNSKYILKTGLDSIKDQTYFLSRLNQDQLSRAFFPIGSMKKSEVRDLAKKFDLPSKERKDSQGICFLGQIKFRDFLRDNLGILSGDILEFETGKKLGEHDGFWYYTIGQRKGLGLSGGPWYVVNKNTKENIVYVSNNYYSQDKDRSEFTVSEFNWILGSCPNKLENIKVKIRHGEYFYNCTLELKKDINNKLNNKLSGVVKIEGRDQGIASGQYAVFYDRDICLGSAVIS